MLKAQLYLYNSVTKNKQSTKIVPDEGIYLHHDGQQCNTEMRFVVEQSDKYDNALLELEGKHEGDYIVALEKVIQAWWINLNYCKLLKTANIKVISCIFFLSSQSIPIPINLPDWKNQKNHKNRTTSPQLRWLGAWKTLPRTRTLPLW